MREIHQDPLQSMQHFLFDPTDDCEGDTESPHPWARRSSSCREGMHHPGTAQSCPEALGDPGFFVSCSVKKNESILYQGIVKLISK